MKLLFSPSQDHQLEAIKAVVDVFEGQPNEGVANAVMEMGEGGQGQVIPELLTGNQLLLADEALLQNVQKIQNAFNKQYAPVRKEDGRQYGAIEVSEKLDGLNFSVEMETGTGKTYAYIRTIHELHKQYGWNKFVIVVPSVAIREGVWKNLQITQEHFARLYDNPKVDMYVYDPKKRGQLREFARASTLQILVINIDSFTKGLRVTDKEEIDPALERFKRQKGANIIYQSSDTGVPIEYLRAVQPVVIVDEPQNMETEIRKQAIANLNPLCTLRYSATHRHPYNLVYRLGPVRAYDKNLVKKIEVDSVLSAETYNEAYVHFIKIIKKGKSKLLARIEIDASDEAGLQKKIIDVECGDDLEEKSGGRAVYKGFQVERISRDTNELEFSNGKSYTVGIRDDHARDQIMKFQIERAVEHHFEKERKFKEYGIKVLTLFFIDQVANYRVHQEGAEPEKGKFAQWFEEAYRTYQAKPKYKGLSPHEAEAVHDGYFAKDKKGGWKDSRERGGEGASTKDDDAAYELIMKDKERLLDPNVPLRFIFSHSALREGWDNPNVFTICTLNETTSEMKKRQEIGRGLRLCVNASGERVEDPQVNVLTVVANERYEDFAKQLQQEIEDETGESFVGRIKDARKRQVLKPQKGFALNPYFADIWERIRQKTKYHVSYTNEEVVDHAASHLEGLEIKKPRLEARRVAISLTEEGIGTEVRDQRGLEMSMFSGPSVIPDVLTGIQRRMQGRVTKMAIWELLQRADLVEAANINPQQVMDECVTALTGALHALMVEGIKYERIAGELYEARQFEDKELEYYMDALHQVRKERKDDTVYDYVPCDSDVERRFVQELEVREDVKFFVKLPSWFQIQTPLGSYNPDWAIVFEHDHCVYFVAETKGEGELRLSEKLKIECGKAHFAELDNVKFQRVTRVEDIQL